MLGSKLSFPKYWIFVVIGIFANIFIFAFLSKQLEEKVFNDIVSRSEALYQEDLISELR
ncbi:MAG: hypothetical protein PHD80_03345 [Candidatus ainarchaeum sp.]|jgi:hypothetical protein|nr:hypothetical protein [Candidatus ainarchaeum sp.]